VTLVSIRWFLGLQAAGGILLLGATVLALLAANLPGLEALYQAFLELPIEIKLGALELKKNVLLVINDGLMAVFFLLVGLEIKREMLEGELASVRRVALPGFAALGGILAPAGIYAAINWSDAAALRGWAIPAATDIAFSLAMLSLLGTRVPLSMKVFLTALAVLDDLAAIVIIAIFYTENLAVGALYAALGGVAALIVLNRAGVKALTPYMLVGLLMWVCVLKSGVHATLAGVALGLAIPMRGRGGDDHSPLRTLEHALHPWVAYLILPLFAFGNAGISFSGVSASALTGPVTLGIAGGLVVGKAFGVYLFARAICALGGASLPTGTSWASMFGVSLLTGIGFTMSLFIGMLAFEGLAAEFAVATRIGVLGGSFVAAVLGLIVLHLTLPAASAAPASAAPPDH